MTRPLISEPLHATTEHSGGCKTGRNKRVKKLARPVIRKRGSWRGRNDDDPQIMEMRTDVTTMMSKRKGLWRGCALTTVEDDEAKDEQARKMTNVRLKRAESPWEPPLISSRLRKRGSCILGIKRASALDACISITQLLSHITGPQHTSTQLISSSLNPTACLSHSRGSIRDLSCSSPVSRDFLSVAQPSFD